MPEDSVLDSSAVLALLQNEAGAPTVARVANAALLSTVNLAEIQSKLLLKGLSKPISWQMIVSLECEVCPFTEQQARITAELVLSTKSLGLSLGDRACLALAMERKATAYTADRSWKNLSLGIEIEVIR